MKYNYTFLQRPAVLCLALIGLVFYANLALAQTRANVTPVRTGGAANRVVQNTTANLLAGAEIAISPPALSDTLNTGKQRTKQITLHNTGTSDLVFSAGIIPDFPPPSGPVRVLVVTDRDYLTYQLPLLFAKAPDVTMHVYPSDNLSSLSLADLTPYDVVYVTTMYPLGDVGITLGNLMADYVDVGGKLIVEPNVFEDEPVEWGLRGRFMEEGYSPVLQANTGPGEAFTSLGSYQADHPFMQGVSSIRYAGGGSWLALQPGASVIARYQNDVILIAATPHVAVVNVFMLHDNHNQNILWGGDIDIIFQNIVRYFKAASAIDVSPVHGTVAPGSQLTLDVNFNATGLDSANYAAGLQVYSNASDTLVTVPVNLLVKGNDIIFEPDTLNEALHKGQAATRTLTIVNNSPDNHSFTITGVPPYATVSPTSGSLASGASAAITVNISSAGLEYATYPGAIALNVDGTTWQAPTSLYVYDDPVIQTNLTSLHDTLAYKDESVRTFELHNTGGSTLTYSVDLVENVSAARSSQAFIASVPILTENFDGPVFPPQGWSVPSSDGRTWRWNDEWVWNNQDYYDNFAGTGKSAMIGAAYPGGLFEMNASLTSPEISTEGYRHFKVEYNANFYKNFDDSLSLEIQVDNGEWKTALVWGFSNGQHGGYFSLPGESVSIVLDDYIDSTATTFRLRWRYARYFGSEFFWYAQVDDIVISGERSNWLDVVPETGSIPPGGKAVLTANFDAQNHLPGVYTGDLKISSNDPQHAVLTIPSSLYVQTPVVLTVSEDSIVKAVVLGDTVVHTLTLTNGGASSTDFDFGQTSFIGAPAAENVQYTTNFDNFSLGHPTRGWYSYYTSNVEIIPEPEGAGRYLRAVSAAGAQAVFSTPFPFIVGQAVSSMRMNFSFSGNLKFKITPLGSNGETVGNIEYDAAQSNVLTIYSYDTVSATFLPHVVPIPVHNDNMNLRYDIMHTTNTFDVYVNGKKMFTGRSLNTQMRGNTVWISNEGAFYVNDFTVTNGIVPEYSKTFSPASGTLAPGESASVDVTFKPVSALAGSYRDTLVVTNSPVGITRIPVHFTIDQNAAPVLQRIDTVEAVQYGQQTVIFKATDADNDPVTITVKGVPAFMKRTGSANGSVTYSIKPASGNTGIYPLTVIATDGGNKKDSMVCQLSVVAYGASGFQVKNTRTGAVYAAFTDSVVLDVADPAYYALKLYAVTKPAKVGSVKFWWDGHTANVENAAPYTLSPFVLAQARGGNHTLKTQAFTKANAKGNKGTAVKAVVRIINSSAVTSFEVVKANGSRLFTLENNGVIDIRQNNCRSINIKANVKGSAIKSVVFKLNGRFHRVDNAAAYMLSGNLFGKDIPWPARPGVYTLEATPYSSWYGLGVAGTPLTITFRVVSGHQAIARVADDEEVLIEETTNARFALYPVPATDVLHISLPEQERGAVQLVIHDIRGRALYTTEGDASAFHDHVISTEKAGLTAGFYYIQVRYANGKREVRKFLKE